MGCTNLWMTNGSCFGISCPLPAPPSRKICKSSLLLSTEYGENNILKITRETERSSQSLKTRNNARKKRGKPLKEQTRKVLIKRQLHLKGYPTTWNEYMKNRKRCAGRTFERNWEKTDRVALLMETQLPFWQVLFEQPFSPDVRIPTRVCEILASMTEPIIVP